jgi:hypothetical protein
MVLGSGGSQRTEVGGRWQELTDVTGAEPDAGGLKLVTVFQPEDQPEAKGCRRVVLRSEGSHGLGLVDS